MGVCWGRGLGRIRGRRRAGWGTLAAVTVGSVGRFSKMRRDISKLGCYYITLFLFRYIMRIMTNMTLLFSIMALLYHLLFCKCPDYYFSLFHYLQKDYYFTYDTSIFSLIFIRLNYCYYCNYHTIICIIFTSNYYCYYIFRRLSLHLFLYVYIISIIAIISLLFALFLYQTIIAIILFETYYVNYLFPSLLLQL